jgi:hypothetical protein
MLEPDRSPTWISIVATTLVDKPVATPLMDELVATTSVDELVVTTLMDELVAPLVDKLFVLKKGPNETLVVCVVLMLCKLLPRFVQLCVKPRPANRKIRERTEKRIVKG